jgi:Flp pilus assembly pilin Flp
MFQADSRVLRCDDRGQDLAEYCLLTALIALVAVGILVYFSGGMQALWGSANTTLAAGNSATSAGAATTAATTGSPTGH